MNSLTNGSINMSERRVEYMALDEVASAPRNPKEHDIGAIAGSVGRFGFAEPPIIDERTGRLVAGHGRIKTLKALRARPGAKPPDGVALDQAGRWLVPVVRGWASRSDADAEAYLVASNKLVELGGWDDEALTVLLGDLAKEGALDGTGYDADDVDRLLSQLQGGNPEEDEVPPVPDDGDTWVKLGEIYQLGEHRLLCGDSTNAEVVAKLLDGAKPLLMVTDPPYGVEYDAACRERVLGPAGRSTGAVNNDARIDWSDAYRLFVGAVAYVWHADGFVKDIAISLEKEGFEIRTQIIWAKPNLTLSRGHYHWQHESCLYAVRKGRNANWHGDHKQTTLWQVNRVNGVEDQAGEDGASAHSTQKPVELYRRSYLNHSVRGDAVYEPFCGSGTAIAAAEVLGRRCFALEIEPKYVQQAIQRWEKLTGGKAKRL